VYCTSDSNSYGVPIRILLIIDTSRSMELNDPTGGRGQAAARLISTLGGSGSDVAFGLIGFNTSATQLTDGFINDAASLTSALSALNTQQGFTNYLDALGVAKTMVDGDLAKVADAMHAAEAQGTDTRYMRPWYFVVFLSDGIPRMPGGILQSADDILFEVSQLMDVPKEAMGITLYTAFLGAADDAERPQAEVLLKQMAEVGQGSYFSFERGEDLDFSIFDFKIKRLYEMKRFLAYNRNARFYNDIVQPDSDGDGLSDLEELERGTDPLAVDTDGDGFGDGYEIRTARDPLVSDRACDQDARLDTDRDGLNDCEEKFLNADKLRFDTDGDLFPDGLEFMVGLNPGDPRDLYADPDFDGTQSGDEILQATDPTIDDRELWPRFAYLLRMQPHFDESKGATCYDFSIANVTIVDTRRTEERPAGLNDIVIQTVESPQDDPQKQFTLNRIIVPVSFARMGGKRAVEIGGTGASFEVLGFQDGARQ